jgi:hypothetical protein
MRSDPVQGGWAAADVRRQPCALRYELSKPLSCLTVNFFFFFFFGPGWLARHSFHLFPTPRCGQSRGVSDGWTPKAGNCPRPRACRLAGCRKTHGRDETPPNNALQQATSHRAPNASCRPTTLGNVPAPVLVPGPLIPAIPSLSELFQLRLHDSVTRKEKKKKGGACTGQKKLHIRLTVVTITRAQTKICRPLNLPPIAFEDAFCTMKQPIEHAHHRHGPNLCGS